MFRSSRLAPHVWDDPKDAQLRECSSNDSSDGSARDLLPYLRPRRKIVAVPTKSRREATLPNFRRLLPLIDKEMLILTFIILCTYKTTTSTLQYFVS